MIHLTAGSSASGLISSPIPSQPKSSTVIRTIRRVLARTLGSFVFAASLALFGALSGFAQAPTLAPGWNQQTPATVPQVRFAPGLAYDAAHAEVVMFGGFGFSNVLNDTWLWNGTNWTAANPANSPSERSNQTMVYDAAQGQVVMFGGANGPQPSNRLGDTWLWNGSTWSLASPASNPPARSSAAMAYDAATGQVVLFGGLGGSSSGGNDLNDTWVWYQNNWTSETTPSNLTARYGANMAYDAALGEVILFGGFDASGNEDTDTWAWNGSSWTPLSPANSPTGRDSAGMDYDPLLGQMVLFGGESKVFNGSNYVTTNLNDTWVLTGNSPSNLAWTLQTYSTSPGARGTNPMVYDAAESQIVMFGGYGNSGQTNDTWTWGTPQGFGNINVCQSGAPAPCSNTLTLTYNVSTTTDFGPSPTVVTQGATGFDFSPALGSTCFGSVSAGNTCTVNVTFAPTAPGLREGAVELFSSTNDVTPLLTTQIFGVGSAPLAAFSPLTTLVQNTGSQILSSPSGVAVDAAGDLFIASGGNGTVVKVPASGPASTIGYQPNVPSSVAVDGAGDVFIGQFGPTVFEVPAGCTQANIQTCQKTLGGFGEANAVAVNAAGDVFVGDQYNREVFEIPVNNQGTQTVVYNPNDSSFLPQGLAVDLAGDLFIADYPEHKVLELPPGGTIATSVGFGWNSPQGVTLDAAGDLYVADSGLQEIVEVPAGCTVASCQIVVASATEASLGSGFGPYGVAVDATGDVYIADVGINRVDTILQQFAGLSFSESTVGNVSGDSPESITLQNVGNQALNATPSWPVFTNPSFYQVAGSGTPADCNSVLALDPGADCNVSIDFDPLTSGLQTGNNPFTLTGFAVFADNSLNHSPSTSQSLPLSGTSLANGSAGAEFLLSVTEGGTGSGSVIDNMGAISCSESSGSVTGTCSGNYAAGASVTLTASAGSASSFVSWGGACASSGTNPTCVVIMSQAQNVIASFANGNFAAAAVCAGGIPTGCTASNFLVTFNFASSTTFSTIQVVTQGATGLDFQQTSGGNCIAGTYGANSSCTVNIAFTPLAPGLRQGAVQLSNGSTVVASQMIYGIGNAPAAAFGPTVTYTLPLTTQGNITFSSQVTGLSNPFSGPIEGMTTDAAGNLYMVGVNASSVGQLLELPPPYTGTPTTVATGFSTPRSVAIDGAGNFYIADPGVHQVVKVLANCSSNCQSTFYSGPEPVGVAVDGLGDVFVADANYFGEGGGDGVVLEYAAGGGGSTQVYNPTGGGATPFGLAVDAAGDLFVADPGLQKVVEVPAGCNVTTNCPEPLIGSGWVEPQGVAVDPAGDVIVADFAYTVAGQVDAGALEEVPAGCTNSNCQILLLTAGAPDPAAVAVSSTGLVFVATDAGAYEINQPQPPAVNFGSVNVGLNAVQTVTMQNIGNQALNSEGFVGVQVNGPYFLANVSAGNTPICDSSTTFVVAPASTCDIGMIFEPSTSGLLTSTAVVTDNALNAAPATQTINLTGTGVSTGPTPNTLNISFTGEGSGTVIDNLSTPVTDCIETNNVLSGACSESYSSATYPTVTLTATASAGSIFVGWGGACASAGTNPQCVVTMIPTTNVAATFSPQALGSLNVCAGGVAAGCIARTFAVSLNVPTNTTVTSVSVVTQGTGNLDFTAGVGSSCQGFTGPGPCIVNVDFAPIAPGLRLGAVELFGSTDNLIVSQPISGIGQGALAAFTAFSSTVASAGSLTGPKGVLVDAAGDLFVSDYEGHKVVEVGPTTNNQVVPIAQSPQIVDPQGLAMDGAGTLYVADTGTPGVMVIPWGCIVTGSSTCQHFVPNPLNLTGQFGVSVDARGDIFVSAYNQNEVVEVSANGGAQTVVYAGNTPIGTVEDAAGDLFVADSNNKQVVKVPAGCSASGCYQYIGSGWTSPNSVALDAAGDLYVVDGGPHNEVVEFPAGCTTNPCSIILASPSTPSLGSTFNPYDAVVDGQGNVFIGDHGNKQVDELPQSQPPTLDFGPVNVGSRSSDIGFTLLNLGNQALTGTVGSASNANFAEDQINSNCGNGNPFSISPGTSCVEGVYAQPQSPISLTGSISLSDNSLNSNPATQTIPLGVAGVATSYTLTITAAAGTGSGIVTDSTNAINCTVFNGTITGTCSASFGVGGSVMLTAASTNGSTFLGWGGACSGTSQPCTVVMNSAASVSAGFAAATYPVSVTLFGSGGAVTSNVGGITCSVSNGTDSGTCASNYAPGSQVILTANPTGNSIFVGWGGDCASSGSSTTCLLTVNSALNPTASFVAPGTNPPGNLQPITAGVVYGQGGSLTSNTDSNGGISANSLSDPAGGALDSNGNLYVGDTGTNRVLFYPRGSMTATRVYGQGGSFTTAGNNQGGISANSLFNPYAVALDSSDNLYVADQANNRVLFYPAGSTTATQVYGQGGNFATAGNNNGGISANSLSAPYGVAVDSSGNLYVGDSGNNRVLFYPAGSTTATRVYGQGGSFTTNSASASANGLHGPLGLTLDSSGDLYVADELNNRVLFFPSGSTTATRVYGQNGNFTSSLANLGGNPSANSLNQPFTVALDSTGNLYVGDTFNHRVLFYLFGSTTATRVYGQLGSFTSNSPNPGGVSADTLVYPEAVALNSDGSIYVADYGNNRVVEFGSFGNVNVCPSGQSTPAPCSNTYTLSYYAATQTTFGATQVVTQGATGLDFAQANGGTCTGTVQAANICTVNVSFTPLAPGLRAGAAELYDTGGNPIASAPVFGIGQAPLAAFGPGTQTVLPITGLNAPSGVALDGAGDLFIADYANNQIVKLASGGVQTTVPTGVLSNPRGVAVDGAGDLFIADDNNNRVLEIPAGCTTSACQVTVPTSGLNISNGNLAVDGAGDIFIADTGNNRVVEVTPSGVQTTVPASGLHQPFGVAVDAAGDVFIADTDNNRVVEVTAAGVQTVVPAVGLQSPEDVWVDAAGDVFIANSIPDNTIVEVPAGGGAQITVYTGATPEGVVTDALGDIFIADTFASRVVEIGRSLPSPVSFAQTTAGARTADIGVTVQNIGNQPLTVSVSAPSTSNFGLDLTNSTCSSAGPPLTPGASCVGDLFFSPLGTALGLLTDASDFNSNTLNLISSVAFQPVNLSGIATSASGQTGTVVPNVVGMTESAAASTLSSVGLTLGTVGSQYSDSQPSGDVVGESPAAGAQVNFGTTVALMLSNGEAPPPTPSPLTFENNYFVTGDYASAGVTLHGSPVTNGVVSGSINIPVSTGPGSAGVPNGADIVDAYLYWTTLEQGAPSGGSGTFLPAGSPVNSAPYSITGTQVGSDLTGYSDGQNSGTLRVYRADVSSYFQVYPGWNGERLGSGNFTVSLPSSGAGTNGVITEGASMVVIYRVLSQNFPLKSVILYDGSAVPGASMGAGVSTTATSLPVQGFYDAVAGTPETTALYYSGGTWNTANVSSSSLSAHASQYPVTLGTGNAYAAVVLSTPVNNSDNDGILDAWKSGPSAPSFFVGQPGYFDVKTQSWVPLPGAAHGQQDLFVQLDYMCGDVQNGVCQSDGENLFPSPDASGNDPLAMVQQAFSQTVVTTPTGQKEKIALHLEIGNAVQETSCTDSASQLCEFPSVSGGLQQPGVIAWKNSLELSKVWPRNFSSCASSTNPDCTARFPYGQKDSYHYVLFGHSLAIAAWTTQAGNIAQIAVTSGGTTITTTTAISSCPTRVTISGVLGDPNLNGIYNASCSNSTTINVATPSTLTTWTYPNSTLPEPDIGITPGTVTSISGYSDLGGADSAVTLALWETDPLENMSTRAQVVAGTLFHEIGHTIGLTHGGLSFSGGTGSYIPTFAPNCAPNFQSSMNYLFQLDGIGATGAIAYSNQTLTPLSESSLGSVTQLLDTDASSPGAAPTLSTSSWYTPSEPTGTTESAATMHCDGTPLSGSPNDTGYRVNGTIDPLPSPLPTWSNNQNIAFDGVAYTTLPGYNDWSNIDLRQVGATGGEFASLASLLSFGSSSSPLSVPAGGSANVGSGGTVALGSNGSVTLTSGGSVTAGSGAVISNSGVTFNTGGNATISAGAVGTITPGTNGTASFASGDSVNLTATGTFTLPSGGSISVPAGDTVTLTGAGSIALNVGTPLASTVTIPSTGGAFTIPSGGGTITLGGGGIVTLGGGGTVTLGGGGNITLGGGGVVTLGGGGTVTLGGGGNITLGGGGTVTLGGGGNITLGGGGTVTLGGGGVVTLGGGGNVTLGGGGVVTLGGGGNVTLGGGGSATLGDGGTVTLGGGGSVTVGANTSATLSGGGTITLGGGGTVTLGGGGSVTLSAGGTLTVGGVTTPVPANVLTSVAAGGIITLGGGGNVTLGGGGNITLGGGGIITLGGGGVVTLGGGGNITLGGGGVITLGGGGNITLGGGGNVTLGGGGIITLGGGGVNTTEMDYNTANSFVRPPPSATYENIPASGNTPASIQVNWTAPAFGVVETYTISREVIVGTTITQPTTVIGSVSGVGTPPNVAPPATTFTDTNPPSTGTVYYTIASTLIPDTNTGTSRQSAPSPPAVLTVNQTITFNQLPSSAVITSSPVTVTATASSGLPVSFNASGPCSIGVLSNSGNAYSASVALSNAGTCSITASQAGNSTTSTTSPAYAAATPVSGSFAILPQGSTPLQSQLITLPVPASVAYGVSPFSVTATSKTSATLMSLTNGNCTVGTTTAGTATVTVVGAGLCQIRASAPQNSTYSAASVTQSFNITAAPLTVTATNTTIPFDVAIPTLAYNITGFVNNDRSSVVSGAPALSTTAIQGSSPGTYPITVSTGSLAAANYSFIFVNGTLTVSTAPTITVSPTSINFGPVAVGSITIKTVTVTNNGDAAATISTPIISVLGAGNADEYVIVNLCPSSLAAGKSCIITVSFVAGAYYNTPQTATLKVMDNAPGSPQLVSLTATVLAPQTITFTTNPPSSAVYNNAFPVAATGGSSGNPVIFTSSGSCSGSGNNATTYTMTSGSGSCSVIANQAGNSTYAAASQVTKTVTATPAAQTITFSLNPPASEAYKSSFTVAATASSGLAVAFTSSGSCSNSGTTYTMTSSAGTCSVIANQAGNSNYSKATQVTKSVSATVAPQTITFTTNAPSSAAYKSTFTVAATASSGLAVTFTSSGACTNAGGNYTMTSSTGACSVIANQAGNSNYSAAPTVTQTANATKGSQTITFTTNAPASAAYKSTFTVAATASSGLGVAFTSSGACTNAGATYTMTNGTGICSVIANQAGNSNYSAAPQVTQTVTAVSTASLTPASLNFGTVSSGKSSAAQTVTLTNKGTTSLAISSIGFTGNNPANFTQTNTCPSSSSSLAAGKSCTISVIFKSSGVAASASLVVTDNTQPSTQTVSLSGN